MKEEYREYEKKIKKVHRFAWTPAYEESIRIDIKQSQAIPLVIKTFEELGWPIVYADEKTVEAKRERDTWQWGNKITVTYEPGKLRIKSVSLGNEFWDLGRNSKRVKLFIYVFNRLAQSHNRESLDKLEKETRAKNNWDDYQIPEKLPQPPDNKKPSIVIPLFSGLITALLLGYILALITVKGTYYFGILEFVVAIIISYVLKYSIKLSNFTDFQKLHYILMATVFLTYFLNLFFQYQIKVYQYNYEAIGFFNFIKWKLETGLILDNINLGWIGWILAWGFQLFFTYYIALMKLSVDLSNYRMSRVPQEVIDFAYYHFVKGKNETQVREELAEKGWKSRQSQDEVIEALVAIQDLMEINRME